MTGRPLGVRNSSTRSRSAKTSAARWSFLTSSWKRIISSKTSRVEAAKALRRCPALKLRPNRRIGGPLEPPPRLDGVGPGRTGPSQPLQREGAQSVGLAGHRRLPARSRGADRTLQKIDRRLGLAERTDHAGSFVEEA